MPLSFFSNSGNSYGSAIPFQRIVEPAQLGFFLNLEQSELLRIQRYNEGWRFYFGRHWLFKREDGEPLVTFNYFRKIIDKSVAFLTAKGFHIKTPESLEEVSKPFLDEVWEYNKREQITVDIATIGAVTGDAFVLVTYEEATVMQKKINPFSQGQIRLNLLGSEQVYPTWDPLNTDTLIAVRIETIYYAERGSRQLDREDRVNHEGRQLYTKRFTQIITPDQIVEQFHGDMPIVRPNLLGEIPIVHIKNLALPKEYYGLPDGIDIVDLQRELNEKATDISDSINYHSAPVTVIYGAKAKQLERGPRQIWAGLPKDSRVETLKLEGDLTAANNYWDKVKKGIMEISDIPEGSLGSMQPISNTSGVALHLQYQPLIEKTKRKRIQYEPGFEQINYFILRIGMIKGLLNLPFDLCKKCGGRIVEVETGKTTKVWNTQIQQFEDRPIRQKRCYHVDKQTLDFTDPFQMRMKFWRKYGFGDEVRELAYEAILREIETQKDSFWDYSVRQKELLKAWTEKNTDQINNVKADADTLMAAPPQVDPETGAEIPSPPPTPDPQTLPKPPEPPAILVTRPLPDGEMDIPEEPEQVNIVRTWINPDTQEVAFTDTVEMFLVPTECKVPQYLNPFETKVEFLDVLPKDEALQAQLYQQYLMMELVDVEWVQNKIPEIAHDAASIRKRMKAKKIRDQKLEPMQSLKSPMGETQVLGPKTPDGNQLAPKPQDQAAVPGEGGNPTTQGNALHMASRGNTYTLTNGGAALGTDASDPNTVAPADTRCFEMNGSKPNPMTDGVWIATKGGTPTITIWFYIAGLDRWFPLLLTGATASFAPAVDVLKTYGLSTFPLMKKCFIQVTAPNGCTGISIGTTQQ
jgi:hypothetical protein